MNKTLVALFLLIFQILPVEAQKETVIEKGGDFFLFALPASSLASTLIYKDGKGFVQFTKGFLVNGITTEALKYFVKKQRPNGTNFKSFPSGHTSITFQSAAFLQMRYGWKFGIPAYAFAAFTGYSRIQSNNHYFIDVVAGAAIGITSSYLFTTKYTKNIEMGVTKDELGTSINIIYKF